VTTNPPKVYAAICKVMREIAKEGIAKTRDNQQTRSKFRGIDDVYNALCVPLADAGLVILPTLVEHAQTERESKAGGALYCSTVVVDYVFVCVEDGSSHTARVVGEAMDSSDKSFSKAMSFAFKYVCFQAFCIPTEGDNDADAHRPEAKPRAPQQQQRREEPRQSPPQSKPLPTKTSANYEPYPGVPFSSMPASALTEYVAHYTKKLPAISQPNQLAATRATIEAAQRELERRIAEDSKSAAGDAP
jgi:ERF superfamily protein